MADIFQAANAIETLANKIGASLQPHQRSELIEILLSGLSGRTWQGKESLLQALASVSTNCRYIMSYINLTYLEE